MDEKPHAHLWAPQPYTAGLAVCTVCGLLEAYTQGRNGVFSLESLKVT
mgnify:CR=1 FL=1